MARRDDEAITHQIEAVRTAIIKATQKVLAHRGGTQKEIACITGLDQPRVSRLMAGVTNAVASERALALLNGLGYDVTITVEPSRSSVGTTRVQSSVQQTRPV